MEDKIDFFVEGNINLPSFFSKKILYKLFENVSSYYDRELGELNFIFCNDEKILEINREHLNHDYYTDVITFDYCIEDILNGDVFISLETVLSNSEKFSTTFEEEFYRVVCHSLLHLIGFKDKTDEEVLVMRENENICLKMVHNN